MAAHWFTMDWMTVCLVSSSIPGGKVTENCCPQHTILKLVESPQSKPEGHWNTKGKMDDSRLYSAVSSMQSAIRAWQVGQGAVI